MQVSLPDLAQQCAEAGFDLFDEALGPHWGRCVAALMQSDRPPERRDDPARTEPPVPDADAPP